MPDPGRQTRRLAPTRDVTRSAKQRHIHGLDVVCESASQDSHPWHEERNNVHVYARVCTRMCKGLKRDSQTRRLADSRDLFRRVGARSSPSAHALGPAPPTTARFRMVHIQPRSSRMRRPIDALTGRRRADSSSKSTDGAHIGEASAATSLASAFATERCVRRLGSRITVDAAYSAFRHWCESRHCQNIPNRATFGRDLHEVLPGLQVRRNRDTGRFYQNLEITDEAR